MQLSAVTKTGKTLLCCVLATAAITACQTRSIVKNDGTTDHPVFPPADYSTTDKKLPVHVNLDNLHTLKAGMTKDDIYGLIGHPHFKEGFRVREWDYLLRFDSAPEVCQLKLLFDKDYLLRTMLWQPQDCSVHAKSKN